jgi:hypothetical protein
MVDPSNTVGTDHEDTEFEDYHEDVYSHLDDDGKLRIVE